MSVAASSEGSPLSPAEQMFAQEYDRTFVEFIRGVVGQGVPVHERALESAHDRATRAAITACTARGYRSTNFAPATKAGLTRMMHRYGY